MTELKNVFMTELGCLMQRRDKQTEREWESGGGGRGETDERITKLDINEITVIHLNAIIVETTTQPASISRQQINQLVSEADVILFLHLMTYGALLKALPRLYNSCTSNKQQPEKKTHS